jgi:hypothetical protein
MLMTRSSFTEPSSQNVMKKRPVGLIPTGRPVLSLAP